LNASESVEQLVRSTRQHRLLFEPYDDDRIAFSVSPCLESDLAVYGMLPRMYTLEGSRFGLVRWLQDRLPGMPDLVELVTEVNELNREAQEVINREVKRVVAAIRHPFPEEWNAACQLMAELREPFDGIGFGIHAVTKGEIVIDVFGANSKGMSDKVSEAALWIKRGSNAAPKVKMRFFEAAMPAGGTVESSF
jgi:hypothetical protein